MISCSPMQRLEFKADFALQVEPASNELTIGPASPDKLNVMKYPKFKIAVDLFNTMSILIYIWATKTTDMHDHRWHKRQQLLSCACNAIYLESLVVGLNQLNSRLI